MADPEINALNTCIEALAELDNEAKMRVLQYVINRFKLTEQNSVSLQTPKLNDYRAPQIVDAVAADMSSAPINRNYTNLNRNYTNFDNLSLKDIVIKNLPKTEVEWLVVYSFYASQFGKEEFKKDDIVSLYEESKRYNIGNRRNLTNNINRAIQKDFIKSLNDTDFIMLDAGIDYVQEILSGKTIVTKQKKPTKKKATAKKKTSNK